MIDFRYHLVSIVAIFLALAVGIVMGTTLLQNPAIQMAKETTDGLIKNNSELRAEKDDLARRQAGNDSFVKDMTPVLALVAGGLSGQRVLLVDTPGSTGALREAQQQVLDQAGATVGQRVTISDKFLALDSEGVLDGLATQLKPADLTYTAGASVYDKVAQLLAATLTTADPTQAGTANAETAAVLAAFEKGGFISVEGDVDKRATLAVMFAPDKPFEGERAETQAAALVSLAAGLDAGSKGALVAGSTTAVAPGGVITELRDSGDISQRVSSIDTLDMPAGRVVGVYALREQIAGRAGQYGIGTGVTDFQPPLPSPTPVPTSSGS
ncbi:copper transporter [Nonomuraea sp. NPDC059007]|uniref:copper transporter n=1 Tax=Nonomuraea sp. NPDC059007 TaxID=3346692 RepID=UPI0036BA38B9